MKKGLNVFLFLFLVIFSGSLVFAQENIGYASSCENNYCALVTGFPLIEYSGHQFSISSIDGEIILNIDGISSKITAEEMVISNLKIYDVSRGLLQNGQEILSFYFISEDDDVVPGPPMLKSFCRNNACTLYEGETIDFLDHFFQVQFILSTKSPERIMTLVIDSTVTSALVEGSIWRIDNETYIYIKDIMHEGSERSVYFETFIPDDDVVPGPPMLNEKEKSCVGCLLNDVCYPLGYRKSGDFCSDDFEFVGQTEAGEICENNFECDSNVCVSGECVSGSLIQKILKWFRSLFGRG